MLGLRLAKLFEVKQFSDLHILHTVCTK